MALSLDRPAVRRMVDDFYDRVRQDALLGPVFEDRVRGRWPEHLDKMVDFWGAALLRESNYFGNPRAVHARLDVEPAHFRRWLVLFEETLRTLFDEDTAAMIYSRAEAMAGGLMGARGYGRHHLYMTAADDA